MKNPKRYTPVIIGRAVVVGGEKTIDDKPVTGWWVPGGHFIESKSEAEACADRMNRLISQMS